MLLRWLVKFISSCTHTTYYSTFYLTQKHFFLKGTLLVQFIKRKNVALLILSIVTSIFLNCIVCEVCQQTRRLQIVRLACQSDVPLSKEVKLTSMSHQCPYSNVKFAALYQ